MSNNNPKKVWKWLKTMPSLSELRAKYPEEWTIVQREISAAYQRSRSEEESPKRLNRASNSATTLPKPARSKPRAGKALDPALSQYIRNRMAQMAIKNYGLIAASGVRKGVVRFNWLNGFIIKGLLFARELERKPVSLFWFRSMWPLVWQKARLMPLAQPEGIYCFYFPTTYRKVGRADRFQVLPRDRRGRWDIDAIPEKSWRPNNRNRQQQLEARRALSRFGRQARCARGFKSLRARGGNLLLASCRQRF